MSSNTNLKKARINKNDEFYTLLEDIKKECDHYINQFEDKIIYLNCDNPEFSNFWKYFSENFENFKLKKLISTHYEKEKQTYKMEIFKDNNEICTTINKLSGNGDFRSPECIELLKEADIVVTNPPFSLFPEYVAQLVEYKKKFLIIGNLNAIIYKNIFPLLKANKIWLGYEHPVEFITPDKNTKKVLTRWYTNLKVKKIYKKIELKKKYNPDDYPKYDNFDAIEVGKIKDIPCNYKGIMGVPITFLDKYNPEQFEIINISGNIDYCLNDCDFFIKCSDEDYKKFKKMDSNWRLHHPYFYKNNKLKTTYTRIFIKVKE